MTNSPTSSPDNGEAACRPILIYLVVAVCAIFLFFSYLSILKRRCSLFDGPPFRDRTLTRFLIEHNLAEDNTPLHFESRGLDFAVVRSLPSIQFRKCEEELGQGSSNCAVCLGEFEEGERLRLLPNCAHIFHVSCIDTWFRTHSTCPLCRSDVLLDFESQDGYSLSIFALMETLRREDAYRESSYGYNVLGSAIMQNSVGWCRPTNWDRFGSESEESDSVSTVSSPPSANDHPNADFQHEKDHTLREGSSSRDDTINRQFT